MQASRRSKRSLGLLVCGIALAVAVFGISFGTTAALLLAPGRVAPQANAMNRSVEILNWNAETLHVSSRYGDFQMVESGESFVTVIPNQVNPFSVKIERQTDSANCWVDLYARDTVVAYHSETLECQVFQAKVAIRSRNQMLDQLSLNREHLRKNR